MRAPERHHSPRPETRQHQNHAGRQLKVLDFGIAKRISADVSTIELTWRKRQITPDELTRDFGDAQRRSRRHGFV